MSGGAKCRCSAGLASFYWPPYWVTDDLMKSRDWQALSVKGQIVFSALQLFCLNSESVYVPMKLYFMETEMRILCNIHVL